MPILTEHQLVEKISKLCPHRSQDLFLGIGDDAAVFSNPSPSGKKMVACQDLLIEKVHFQRETHTAEDLGYKSLAVNFSDVAAMGAVPFFVMISLAIPKNIKLDQWVEDFYRGADLICKKFGATIMGGDLSGSPEHIFIDVSVIGVCNNQPILRNGAQPGDLIGITGPLGLSHVGYQVLQHSLLENQLEPSQLLCAANLNPYSANFGRFPISVGRHLRPTPRIDEAKAIGKYVNALIDISDGLVNDLNIVLGQSSKESNQNLIAQLDCSTPLFLHPEVAQYHQLLKHQTQALDLPFYGGEDFELLFTFPPEHFDKIHLSLKESNWMTIGKVVSASIKTEDNIFYLQGKNFEPVDLSKRWQHF